MSSKEKIKVDISHLTKKDYEQVYAPCDDTWLVVDSLQESEFHFLKTRFENQPLCFYCEIGTGSGYISTFFDVLFRTCSSPQFVKFCTDINPHACAIAKSTMLHNQVNMSRTQIVQTNFLDAFAVRLYKQFDVIVFNPPYVPTPHEELNRTDIYASWAGGWKGREVVDQLLPQLQHLLSDRGVFYLIAMDENDPEEMCHLMASDEYGNYSSEIVKEQIRGEHLYLLKFYKP